MKRRSVDLAAVVKMIRHHEPFAFSRWGDGEWSAILGHGTANCDGQAYTAELRLELGEVLKRRPEYLLGMQRLALRRFGPEIKAWLEHHELRDLEWTDAGIFHSASIRDELAPLWEVLRERGVVLVGPERLRGLHQALNVTDHVAIPTRNAYSEVDSIFGRILARAPSAEPVIALSAGMGAKVLIHRLYEALPQRTMIDFGSLWEPYVGHANRTYHHQILERLSA